MQTTITNGVFVTYDEIQELMRHDRFNVALMDHLFTVTLAVIVAFAVYAVVARICAANYAEKLLDEYCEEVIEVAGEEKRCTLRFGHKGPHGTYAGPEIIH